MKRTPFYFDAMMTLIFCGMALLMTGSSTPAGLSGISSDNRTDRSSMMDIDYRYLVSRADLVYNSPVTRSEEGMPIGNGKMGSLVWTTPDALKLQINRVDIFANNSASNNFFERHSNYCGGAGLVDIDFVDFGREVFTPGNFFQQLSCYDGIVTTKGDGIEVKTIVWNAKDVMAVQVKDKRGDSSPVNINLRLLRPPVSRRGNHTALSIPDIIDGRLVLKQVFTEDDYYCASAVVIGVTGADIRTEYSDEWGTKLSIAPGSGNFQVFIASSASMDTIQDVVDLAIHNCKAAESRGFENLLKSNQAWWHGFWQKSFVHLHSDDGEAEFIEENYNYFLYVMASSSRGAYPPKFNGMLWTTGGDARQWGSLYWGANQSCLYNGLFPTNRFELMDPMFDMYTAMFPSLGMAARQQWNSRGIYIPETVGFEGLPELPDDISQEMSELYLLEKPWENRSQNFSDYAFTKMPFLSRWNWKQDAGWSDGRWHITDKGAGPFGHVSHIFSRGAKIAFQYWMRFEYTQDAGWLENRAYPMLRGIAEFYRSYPHVKKEKDGRYHIYNVNDNESVWGGHNTAEEISSIKGIFPVVIRASEILGVDEEMRPVWREFVNNFSSLPTSTDLPGLSDTGKEPVWIKSLPPVIRGNPGGSPDPNTMPMWFFDLCNLENRDPERLAIANNTYDAYFRDGINEETRMNVLSKLAVAGTILGRKEAARFLIPNQIRTRETEVLSNRMTLREGNQTTGLQRLGRVADALHNALCQGIPPGPGEVPIINVYPAWPEEWDAAFGLLMRGGFFVKSSLTDGEIDFVEIASVVGGKCRIRNPWPGSVDVYRSGKKTVDQTDPVLEMDTRRGDVIVIVPAGADPDLRQKNISGSEP